MAGLNRPRIMPLQLIFLCNISNTLEDLTSQQVLRASLERCRIWEIQLSIH